MTALTLKSWLKDLSLTSLVAGGTLATLLAISPKARAQNQTAPFDHRSSGLVEDSFTLDGNEYWTAENGGRIGHGRISTSFFEYQNVPIAVKDSLRRIFFVTDGTPLDGPTGWAVGFNGNIVQTKNGGATWATLPCSPIPAVLSDPERSPYEELYSVNFLDEFRGWLVGLHEIFYTTDSGNTWTPCNLYMQDGHAIYFHDPVLGDVKDVALLSITELYNIDVVERHITQPGPPGTPPLIQLVGMACAEPGLVFKTTDGINWNVVFDIRCLCSNCSPGTPDSTCYDCDPNHLPPITGTFGPATCEATLCNRTSSHEHQPVYEPWDVVMNHNGTTKFAALVGGIGHTCGMAFTSSNDGATWTKEAHECAVAGYNAACGSNDPGYLYHDVPQGDPRWTTHTFRHSEFGTLYGAAVLDADNTVIAGGYGGQVLRRNPFTGVWEDKSHYSHRITEVPSAVTGPVNGATTVHNGNGTTGIGYLTGYFGMVLRTTTGGQSTSPGQEWTTVRYDGPWRMRDLALGVPDDAKGWQIGQLQRISRTTDSGKTWLPPTGNEGTLGTQFLNAIAISGDGTRGVAVGDMDGDGVPTIWWTSSATSAVKWSVAESIRVPYPGDLKAVAWAGDVNSLEFWAAGTRGCILHSVDGGRNWLQFAPPDGFGNDDAIAFNGIAFQSPSAGILVGYGQDPLLTPSRGVAFLVDPTSTTATWTSISPNYTSSPLYEVTNLCDVDFSGTTAYAVGDLYSGTPRVRSGIVLSTVLSGASTARFTALTTPTNGFPECKGTDSLDQIPDSPVLARLGVVKSGTHAGDVWVGGQCGRVWRLTGSSWDPTDYQSQTDTHFLGISFPSSAHGYFVGYRREQPGQDMVRFTYP